jgi:hypothetical protein
MKQLLKKALIILCACSVGLLANAQTVRIIHNAAIPGVTDSVDIFLEAAAGSIKALDDFKFRDQTQLMMLPVTSGRVVVCKPNTGATYTPADTLFSQFIALGRNDTTVVIAGGGPSTAPKLFFEKITGKAGTGKIRLKVFHGSPGAPNVDVWARGTSKATKLISDLAYGSSSGFLEVDPGSLLLEVRAAGTQAVVRRYNIALDAAFAGKTLLVLASGLLTGTPSFDLFASDVLTAPLTTDPPTSSLLNISTDKRALAQVLHACAAADSVDIYLNGAKAIDNLNFKEATPFVALPYDVDLSIGVAPANSTGEADTLVTFRNYKLSSFQPYYLVAAGTIGSGYTPAQPFTILVGENAETEAAAGTVGVRVLHASTDAPVVRVLYSGIPLFDSLEYKEFTNAYLPLPLSPVPTGELEVQPVAGGEGIKFTLDLTPFVSLVDGITVLVFANGFLDPSKNNNDKDSISLDIALSTGGPSVKLQRVYTVGMSSKISGNLPTVVFPNPAGDQVVFGLGRPIDSPMELVITDMTGRVVLTEKYTPNSANRITVATGHLPRGCYSYQLSGANSMSTGKLILK